MSYLRSIASVLILFMAGTTSFVAQNYWQQECNYEIEVTLDDLNHALNAYLKLEYTNNSPDELEFIYFHLWPNAYSSRATAFAKQEIENGLVDFHRALPSELGSIGNYEFTVNGTAATVEIDAVHPDICKLILPKTLAAGEKILIESPFKVKIPQSFSRLGHVETSYQITQWYPKPAVYDKDGWHQMPYLSQGEFYSEFGSFDVKITLPANYVVGATGDLQTESEIDFLNEIAEKTARIEEFSNDNAFPASSLDFKTLHYTQNNVHDFAWFADKRFHVLKETFKLPGSKKSIDAWAMFTNKEADLWKEGAKYVRDATLFYSEKVGAYPYNHATAVQSALSAGAGMEYPNITVIGVSGSPRSLENVIVHEVGHNWFYGQLGSNERAHPWMDEGINSYYEQRYFREMYPESNALEEFGLPDFVSKMFGLEGRSTSDLYEILYQMGARKRDDQSIHLHSEEFTSTNYGTIVYIKALLAFNYLESYLGRNNLDKIFQEYYKRFEFKHPQPDDLRALFEEESNKPVDWFFDELIGTDKRVNYWLYKLNKEGQSIGDDKFDVITVRNHPHHNVAGPYPITAIKDDQPVKTVWYDGFYGQEEVLFPSMEYDKLVLDYYRVMPEYDRKNNDLKSTGLFKGFGGLDVNVIPKAESIDKSQLNIFPIGGFNKYNGGMAGMVFYNSLIPGKKFNYTFAPMYSFRSKTLAGMGSINYNHYPVNGFLKKIGLGLNAKTFAYDDFRLDGEPGTAEKVPHSYYRLAPEVNFVLRNHPRSRKKSEITLRHISLMFDIPDEQFPPSNFFEDYRYINELEYNYNYDGAVNQFNLKLTGQQAKQMLYASIEADYSIEYSKKGHSFDIRVFGGSFIKNDPFDLGTSRERQYEINLTAFGQYDYTYENEYFGRNESEIPGFYSNQVYIEQGGFKNPSVNGTSLSYLISTNIVADLPLGQLKLPIKVYADFGYHPEFFTDGVYKEQFVYDIGPMLSLFNDNVCVYLPLVSHSLFSQALTKKWYQRLAFQINLDKLQPIKLIRDAKI